MLWKNLNIQKYTLQVVKSIHTPLHSQKRFQMESGAKYKNKNYKSNKNIEKSIEYTFPDLFIFMTLG